MPITPTKADMTVIRRTTAPSPPNKDGGSTETFLEMNDERGKKLTAQVQRSYYGSQDHNTLSPPPIAMCDWVIEEEIPDNHISFLSWPTRRCFMEDNIQLRVQVDNVKLDATAWVVLWVERINRISNDTALMLGTEAATVNARTGCWYKYHFPLEANADLSTAAFADASQKILYQVCSADGTDSTCILTTIRLPAPPDDAETESENYRFKIRIGMAGRIIEASSPDLKAMRWWANPSKNLSQPKTNASAVTPLVDGEVFFNKCEEIIRGAAASICIAGWGLYMDTLLTSMPAMNGVMLSELLLQKANAGVHVYIMLGEVNNGSNSVRGFKSQLLTFTGAVGEENDISHYTVDCESLLHRNIHFKIHKHPLEMAGNVLGSFHEKYVVADNAKATLGGIDFQPNRYQSQAHDWKMDTEAFNELATRRKRYNADTDTDGETLYAAGHEIGFGVAAANGIANYTLPTYLPAHGKRAILAWLKPNVIRLNVSQRGNPESYTIADNPPRSYYYLYQDGALTNSEAVPQDGIVHYTLGAVTAQAELVWWNLDKPEIIDLNFNHMGAAETYAILSNGRAVGKAMWFVKIPGLENSIAGTVESGEGMRWHDAGVYVEGDIVNNIYNDFVRRWNLAGEDLGCIVPTDRRNRMVMPALVQTPDPKLHNTQVAKTGVYSLAGDCKFQGTFDVYKQAIRQARHYIYIENQYFTWPDLGDELCNALEQNPLLQVMVIVPFFTEEAANLGDRKYESVTLWGMLGKLISGKIDQQEMKDRGVRHQQWQQANLINRLRAVTQAGNRVGIYNTVGNLPEYRVARPMTVPLNYDDGNPIDGAVWSFQIDGVERTHGFTDANGIVHFTIPANAKLPVLKWDIPQAPTILNLSLANAGNPESTFLLDLGNPLDEARWRINFVRREFPVHGQTDGTGHAHFTIPADAGGAVLQYWIPFLIDFPDVSHAGAPESHILNDGVNPYDALTWFLVADNVAGPIGKTGPDGKVDFTLPVGTLSAHIVAWQLDEAPILFDLDLINKGNPQIIQIDDPGTGLAAEDAIWQIEVLRYGEFTGTTGPDGKVDFTLPADTFVADLCYQPKPGVYRFEISYATPEMIYPHSKIMIVDDTWAIIGSANANGRSFVTDEEINVVIHDRTTVTAVRKSLWHEHLNLTMETRAIRRFAGTWKTTALPAVNKPGDCDPAQANTIHAVHLGVPPPGQEYNGPLSGAIDMGKMV